jgi:type IV pilus assembly protein PilC
VFEGEIYALNQDEASFKLKEQKVIITNLIKSKKKKGEKEKTKSKSKGFSLFGKKKAKAEDILIFSKQFATMVKAGLPILQTLEMLRDQLENPAMKDVVEDIRKSLEGGITLSKCFEKYPEYFDNVYCNLIKAGEASGRLDTFLLKIVEALEKKEGIKKKLKSALMYPSIMFTVAMAVSAFMLINVVPVFAGMYDGMGIALPKSTGTTFININALTAIATVNIMLGYIKALFNFFLIPSFFSKASTIFNRNVSNLPLASPALIKLQYTLSKYSGYFSKHLDKVIPPSRLFLMSSTTSFIAGFSS